MKRYKFQALVTPLHPVGGAPAVQLTGPAYRMVLRARHVRTGVAQLFSALISPAADQVPGDGVVLTVTVLGDDAGDYFGPGQPFSLWRGADVGHGVVSRRVFV